MSIAFINRSIDSANNILDALGHHKITYDITFTSNLFILSINGCKPLKITFDQYGEERITCLANELNRQAFILRYSKDIDGPNFLAHLNKACLKFLKFEEKLKSLTDSIDQLEAISKKLQVKNPDDAKCFAQLHKTLKEKLHGFSMSFRQLANTDHIQQLKEEIQVLFQQEPVKKATQKHYHLWKPILTNIALFFTGFGAIYILGHLAATSELPFFKTNREKAMERINQSTESLKQPFLGMSKNGVFFTTHY